MRLLVVGVGHRSALEDGGVEAEAGGRKCGGRACDTTSDDE